MASVNGNFSLKSEPVENLRPIKVIVIGAGFSGILAAIRIPEKIRNVDLVVYEQSDGIGGVWWLNRYPGLACDVPSHSYQYTFAPNPRWSAVYASGKEIQEYLQSVAEKFGATRFIKTSHKVEKCVWDAAANRWAVTVFQNATGDRLEDSADIVVTARGNLNDISWPELSGLEGFRGKLLHSAEWDEEYDYTHKSIGVIGNGSSAIQIVPALQALPGVHLTCFVRSPTWISSPFGDAAMVQLGRDPSDPEFTPTEREALAADATGYLHARKVIEDAGNLQHASTLRGTPVQRHLQGVFERSMRERLASRPELLQCTLPSFAPGCRRLTPGTGYLEALTAPNVDVVSDEIASVSGDGSSVVLASGREVSLDVLVCATGFTASAPPNFDVVGRGGLTLARRWHSRPESYLSVAVDGFPNFLMMFGPNSAIGFGSLTKILEAEADYVVKVVRKLQKEDYASIEPRPERVADFTSYIGEYFSHTVYMDKCKSWYRSQGGRGDWVSGLWPGSTLHALEVLRSPRWEDFVYESIDPMGNQLRWLGNGWSITQSEGDPSWYLNPDEVEIPNEGKPEESKRYKARPWSH